MAKVKIQGHAQGTGIFTVTAPNSNTDRTITLPDADVTLGTDATKLPLTGGTLTGDLTVTDSDMQLITKSAIGTAEHEAGGGFSHIGSSTQGNRVARFWLDADGANFSGSDYYYIQKNAGGGVEHIVQNNADMKFATNGSTRMTISNSGDMTLNSGNIVMSGSNGILLGGTGAVNKLDDYEEGSWTPAFTASGGSAGSVAHSVQEGYYTKIGRLVTCQFNLTLTNRGSWSGEVRLTGLPFDPADTFPAAGSVSLDNVNVPNDASSHDVYVNPGVTYFRFYYTVDFSSRTFVQVSQVTDSADFNGTISYIV
tara:strand:+ start:1524 stop:2453 length:930 start_codon:yes stop_codon:yes gene_type:complete